MKSGAIMILDERDRQITQEGFGFDHDDAQKDGQLAKAAESYLCIVCCPDEEGDENGKVRPQYDWPWSKADWKPSNNPIRNLVKAGALIAAEIDRLQRIKK